MDEVLEKLGSNRIGSGANECGKTNSESLYKNWEKLGNQEQRRKDILDIQKSQRNDNLDSFRGVLDLVKYAVDDQDIFKYRKAMYRPSIYVAGFTKTSSSYKNVLMMSEWMIEKPEDFHENWLVTPCPKGVRTLVIASHGKTKCYTKFGHFRLECSTALPGGNPCWYGNKTRCCILDCFHVDATNTMYILDLLAWNSQPMTDGETEFRQYWLQSHLEEIPESKVLSKNNKLIFKLLPKVSCSPESFNEFMMKIPHFEDDTPKLDGLLFFHKRAQYFGGQTPLVGWLFPFMVPEVIGSDVTVNAAYMVAKPPDYVCQANFIQIFEERMAKRKDNKRKCNSMDTTPPPLDKQTDPETHNDDMEADLTPDTPKLRGKNKQSDNNNGKQTEEME